MSINLPCGTAWFDGEYNYDWMPLEMGMEMGMDI